jgi:hypothetical protein
LKKVDGFSASDPKLAREMGEIYIRIAELQQSGAKPQFSDKEGAVVSYTGAARQFVRAALVAPQDEELRIRLAEVERRLTRLEARVPPEVIAIIHPPADQPPRVKNPQTAAVVNRESVTTKSPVRGADPVEVMAEPAGEDARQPQGEVLALLEQVQSRVDMAEQSYQQLKADVAAQGLAVHPRTTGFYLQMQSRMESARRQLERGDAAGAAESLRIAREFAARIIQNR